MTTDEFKRVVVALESHWYRDEPSGHTFIQMGQELAEYPVEEVEAAVTALAREGQRFMPMAGQIVKKLIELRIDAPTWGEAMKALRLGARRLEAFEYPDACLDGVEGCDGTGWKSSKEKHERPVRKMCSCAKKLSKQDLRRTEKCLDGNADCDGAGWRRVVEEYETDVAERCSCTPKLVELRNPGLSPILASFVELVGWATIKDMLVGDTTAEAQLRNKYADHVKTAVEMQSLVGLSAKTLPRVVRANRELPAGVHVSIPTPKLRELST